MENEEQALAGKKEQGMSYREFELVQEYAKAKLEAQSELQYEDLSDYEIPPRTQFSMLKKPAVSIKYKEITFNMTCVRMFEGITNVLMSLSSNKKRLAVITRKEEGASTVEWSRKKEDKFVNKTITSLEFTDAIYKLMNWDRGNRYKVLGRIANSAEGLILVFDLEEAIMFDNTLMLRPCESKDVMSFQAPKNFLSNHNTNFRVHSLKFVRELLESNNLEQETTYLLEGTFSKRHNAVIFPLNTATLLNETSACED